MFVKLEPLADVPLADDAAATSVGNCDPRLGTLAGNYRLVGRLGAGGMAAVYRAEHKDLSGAVVAVKLLDRRWAATPGAGRRFLREAQAMFEIVGRNRHIPRVLDFGQTAAGENYMVMEYLCGHDLAQVLKREGPLPWSRVAPLALQLCEALAAAHARGILHRDIKPSNCFLVEEDGAEIVKLIDFGVAKDLRALEDQTSEGVIIGTPAFLAPEILIDGARPSVASDVYSLGATLYRLLTNRPHVTGQTWQDIAYRLQFVPLLPPSNHVGPALSVEVDELVLRAVDREPSKRHASALELADAIRGLLLPTEPGSAQRVGCTARTLPAARVGRSGARRTLVFGAVPLLALGVLAFSDAPRALTTRGLSMGAAPRPAEMACVETSPPAFEPPEPVMLPAPAVTSGEPVSSTVAMGDRLERLEDAVQTLSRQLDEEQGPDGAGSTTPRAPKPARQAPATRQRSIRRDLNTVKSAAAVCFARHGDNLVAELPVRVQVSPAGAAERVTLPKNSREALVECVNQAIRGRRYEAGPTTETVRHVFKFRES